MVALFEEVAVVEFLGFVIIPMLSFLSQEGPFCLRALFFSPVQVHF